MKLTPEENQPKLVDTIRLILTLDCNLNCDYCCNKLEPVYSRFVQKSFDEIDFSRYRNVCLTGGEPFLYKKLLYETIRKIPATKDIYIYSNGIMITNNDIIKLLQIDNLKGINIGLHTIDQFRLIHNMIDYLPVRYMAQNNMVDEFIKRYPNRLNVKNVKGWVLNECNKPNEHWVLLR